MVLLEISRALWWIFRALSRMYSHVRLHKTEIYNEILKHEILKHTATHCSTLQYTATTHCNNTLQQTATNCNTLQHTATHPYESVHDRNLPIDGGDVAASQCNTRNTLHHTASHYITPHHTATRCNIPVLMCTRRKSAQWRRQRGCK